MGRSVGLRQRSLSLLLDTLQDGEKTLAPVLAGRRRLVVGDRAGSRPRRQNRIRDYCIIRLAAILDYARCLLPSQRFNLVVPSSRTGMYGPGLLFLFVCLSSLPLNIRREQSQRRWKAHTE